MQSFSEKSSLGLLNFDPFVITSPMENCCLIGKCILGIHLSISDYPAFEDPFLTLHFAS